MTKKELKREFKLLEADFEVVSHSRKAWEKLAYKIAGERDLAEAQIADLKEELEKAVRGRDLAYTDMHDAETAANEAESKLDDIYGEKEYWRQTALIIEEQYDRLLTERKEADAIIDADAERIELMGEEIEMLRGALEEIDFNAAYLEGSPIPRAEFWKHTASVRREIARKALGRYDKVERDSNGNIIPEEELQRWENETGEHRDSYPL